jgi:hypothetical protein
MVFVEHTENMRVWMVPLYAAKVEDLGPGDFVKIDFAACGHTALLTAAFRPGLDWSRTTGCSI